jgi:hypothetical protein
MSEVASEWIVFGRIILNAGQSTTWWFSSSLFNEARVVNFDTSPDQVSPSPPQLMSIQVVEQWTERSPGGGVNYLVTFRNRGIASLTFRPRVAIIPAGRFFGGNSA